MVTLRLRLRLPSAYATDFFGATFFAAAVCGEGFMLLPELSAPVLGSRWPPVSVFVVVFPDGLIVCSSIVAVRKTTIGGNRHSRCDPVKSLDGAATFRT